MSLLLDGTLGVPVTTVTGTLPVANGGTGVTTAIDYGFKNRIINGGMVIDQRNAGASVTANNGVFSADRYAVVATQVSKGTIQQVTTAPTGFSNSLLFTSSSAYSVLAGDAFNIVQAIEGFNTADLNWGTANASAVTLSFRVYSSLTGTFGGALNNSAYTRSYPFTYSIPVANTWTTISVTIAGDTTGTWIGATNGAGIRVQFSLGAGTTFSGTAGAWAATQYQSATGAVSVVGTNGATFYITGVQLEKGSTATSFDYRPYGTELSLCQRYYEFGQNKLYVASAGAIGLGTLYKVAKRSAATLAFAGSSQGTNLPSSLEASDTNGFFVYVGSGGQLNYLFTASAEL